MDEIRQTVRANYHFRCGYCGVSEADSGSELEIDHYRPQSRGGGDEPENLVYCCPKCNQYKGSYWHETDPPHIIRLLHPRRDDFREHLREKDNGEIIGKTKEGSFLIQRIHLNRPALIAYRLNKHAERQRQNELNAAKEREQALLQRIEELDAALQTVISQIEAEVE